MLDELLFWTPIVIFILILLVGVYVMVTWGDGLKKRKQKVLDVIISSQVIAVSEISKLTRIKEKHLISIIQSLIAHANEDWSPFNGTEVLRDARLDLNKLEIILPVAKEDWICVYCRAVNEANAFTCTSCQAPKKRLG